MKLLPIIALLLATSCSHLQRTPKADLQPFEYTFKSLLPKKDIFTRYMLWMASNFKNKDNVIDFKDEAICSVRGHSRTCIRPKGQSYDNCLIYRLSIDHREGVSKLTFHSLEGLAHFEDGYMVPGADITYLSQYKAMKAHFDDMAHRWFVDMGE